MKKISAFVFESIRDSVVPLIAQVGSTLFKVVVLDGLPENKSLWPWADYIPYMWFIFVCLVCFIINRGIIMRRQKYKGLILPRWLSFCLMLIGNAFMCWLRLRYGTAGSSLETRVFTFFFALIATWASMIFVWPRSQWLKIHRRPVHSV